MDYFNLGSKISYSDFNAIVYLLRKFKRLTSDLKLGNSIISSDYGNYNITGGLTSVGGNFILEDDVTISSSDVLLNCFYTFIFTVVDVNLSGTVNRRIISVTGDTGDDGILEIILEPSLLESDEVILPDFKVDIVFDEHEYYTPVSTLDITLEVDKSYISVGETATVTATVLDDTGTPVEDLDLQFKVNDAVEKITTDESGVAVLEYTGVGGGWVNVTVIGQRVKFYDGEVLTASVTGNSITLGGQEGHFWLSSVGEVIIDWGDGTTDTVNNPYSLLTHNYADGITNHNIVFVGEVTGFNQCFYKCTNLTTISIPNSVTRLFSNTFDGCTGLTSVSIPSSVTRIDFYGFKDCTSLTTVSIPDSVTSIGTACFRGCTSLTSVTIPNSVTSLGDYCFSGCLALVDYQLYWTGNNIITYNSNKMPNNPNTIFTIPYETTNNYLSKSYPSSKLRERGLNLELTSDKPIIQSTETSTITATLTHDEEPLTSKTLNYVIKHGTTVISSGTDTTDNNGQISFTYTGTGVGDVSVIISYASLLQETYSLLDCLFYDEATSNTKWNTNYADVTTNREIVSDGTKLYYSAESGTKYCNTVIGSTRNWFDSTKSYQIDLDFTYERDNSNCAVGIGVGNNGYNIHNHFNGALTGSGHYKIIIDGNTYQFYLDGVAKGSPISINGNNGLFFLIYRTGSFTFKNLTIIEI